MNTLTAGLRSREKESPSCLRGGNKKKLSAGKIRLCTKTIKVKWFQFCSHTRPPYTTQFLTSWHPHHINKDDINTMGCVVIGKSTTGWCEVTRPEDLTAVTAMTSQIKSFIPFTPFFKKITTISVIFICLYFNLTLIPDSNAISSFLSTFLWCKTYRKGFTSDH